MVRRGQTKSERFGLARACSGLLGWVCCTRAGWCFPLSERLSERRDRRPIVVRRRSIVARPRARSPRRRALGVGG